MGYRQAVKAQDFDSCIVGSNPTSPVLVLSIKYLFLSILFKYTLYTFYIILLNTNKSIGIDTNI